jgi:hypothetical protein
MHEELRRQKPLLRLTDAYGDYMAVKICVEFQRGYSQIIIANDALENARKWVAGIEQKFDKKDVDEAWQGAAKDWNALRSLANSSLSGATPAQVRKYCQFIMHCRAITKNSLEQR